MKDEYKILIGAIVVILLVLVGAFALGGSNNSGAKVTPTATVAPVNNPTATATPGGNGNNTGTPSATPTVVPSATPVPTPTTEPGSGVKLTEFGYWITYPPLPPQNWSEYKRPGNGNIVYFNPTSSTIPANYFRRDAESMISKGDVPGLTCVHRSGNLSGTVVVNLTLTASDNVHYGMPASVDYDYYVDVTGQDANLTQTGSNTYNLTLGQNVTEYQLRIIFRPVMIGSLRAEMPAYPEGWAKLTMTGVSSDCGYGIGAKDFTATIKSMPVVDFDTTEGDIWEYDNSVDNSTGSFGSVDSSGSIVYVTIPVSRETSTGAWPVNFGWYLYDYGQGPEFPSDGLTINSFAFADGTDTGYLTVGINKSMILANENYYDISIYIANGDNYCPGYASNFWLTINDRDY